MTMIKPRDEATALQMIEIALSAEQKRALTRVLRVAQDYEAIVRYESGLLDKNFCNIGQRLSQTLAFKSLRDGDFQIVERLVSGIPS